MSDPTRGSGEMGEVDRATLRQLREWCEIARPYADATFVGDASVTAMLKLFTALERVQQTHEALLAERDHERHEKETVADAMQAYAKWARERHEAILAQLNENDKEKDRVTRVDDSQYEPLPSVAEPLATAAENKPPPTKDDDLPIETRRELMRCATNTNINYYYLCDVVRRALKGVAREDAARNPISRGNERSE